MSSPFVSTHGVNPLAHIDRATMPRDYDEATAHHAEVTAEIDRLGDRAKVAHALVHARGLTVHAIDSAYATVGEPCQTPDDVVRTWRLHRDSGVAVPVGHHSGQTLIAVRADSWDAWKEWLGDAAGYVLTKADFDGRTFGEERGLLELGVHSVLTRSDDRPSPLMKVRTYLGTGVDRAIATKSLAPGTPNGPVFALWLVAHRSHYVPADGGSALTLARPDVRPRKLADGVKLLGQGDLVTVATPYGSGERVAGDVPRQIDGTEPGVDLLVTTLQAQWKEAR